MADDGIFLGGYPVLLDLDAQLQSFLDDWLPQEWAQQPRPMAQYDPRTGRVGDLNLGPTLPLVNYPPRPQLEINQLYWPTGAARWTEAYVVVDGVTATAIGQLRTRSNYESPLPLRVQFGGWQQQMDLYVEQMTGLSLSNDLWLVHLVDVRYWWQHMGLGASPTGRPIASGAPGLFTPSRWDTPRLTWPTVINWIAYSIGQGIYYDAILSSYGWPDPVALSRPFENLGQFFDAVAHSLGMRVIRDLDGTVRMLGPGSSMARDWMLNIRAPKPLLAGGDQDLYPQGQRLLVAFPICREGHLDDRWKYYWIDVSWAGDGSVALNVIDEMKYRWENCPKPQTYFGIPGYSEVVFSSCLADIRLTEEPYPYNPDAVVNPINYAALSELAQKIFRDWSNYDGYSRYAYDVVCAGLQSPVPHGFLDYVLWDFGREQAPEQHLEISEEDGADAPAPELVTTRKRKFTTRLRSMPRRVGVRQQLSQDLSVPLVDMPTFRITRYKDDSDYDYIEALHPGSWAYAYWCDHQTHLNRDPELRVEIWDARHWAFAFVGEVVVANWNVELCRWETAVPHGLLRKGVISSTLGITPPNTGSVTLYKYELVTTPEINITARLAWMAGTQKAEKDQECTVYYDQDEQQWWIIGLEC